MLRCWWVAMAALWIAAGSGRAEAATIYSDTVLVSGPEYLSVVELPVQLPGTYRITATDLKWLNTPLQALSFGVFTSTQSLGTHSGAGTLEFFNAGQGKVFLQVYAKTAAPRFAGLVGLTGDAVAVVPLPASLPLLLSGLGAAAWLRRRRRACDADNALAPAPV